MGLPAPGEPSALQVPALVGTVRRQDVSSDTQLTVIISDSLQNPELEGCSQFASFQTSQQELQPRGPSGEFSRDGLWEPQV